VGERPGIAVQLLVGLADLCGSEGEMVDAGEHLLEGQA
jgi:hypothetical protein